MEITCHMFTSLTTPTSQRGEREDKSAQHQLILPEHLFYPFACFNLLLKNNLNLSIIYVNIFGSYILDKYFKKLNNSILIEYLQVIINIWFITGEFAVKDISDINYMQLNIFIYTYYQFTCKYLHGILNFKVSIQRLDTQNVTDLLMFEQNILLYIYIYINQEELECSNLCPLVV